MRQVCTYRFETADIPAEDFAMSRVHSRSGLNQEIRGNCSNAQALT